MWPFTTDNWIHMYLGFVFVDGSHFAVPLSFIQHFLSHVSILNGTYLYPFRNYTVTQFISSHKVLWVYLQVQSLSGFCFVFFSPNNQWRFGFHFVCLFAMQSSILVLAIHVWTVVSVSSSQGLLIHAFAPANGRAAIVLNVSLKIHFSSRNRIVESDYFLMIYDLFI